MLSRSERVLAELVVSRGQVTRDVMGGVARRAESSPLSLSDLLVLGGHLTRDQLRTLELEAGAVERAFTEAWSHPARMGDFQLEREIGRGGMGIVYEAESVSSGDRVAVKVLPAGAALDENMRRRFLREIKAVASLDHPGIVSVLGSGEYEGALFYAMELLEGGSLESKLGPGPCREEDAARWMAESARALAAAHAEGLIHRDIKPSNILLDREGRVRIVDFGLVHVDDDASLTRTAAVLGTPAYLAPEQARGRSVDPRCDIYALGAVLYALLSGGPAHPGDVPSLVLASVLTTDPEPLTRRRPGLSPELVAICERAMRRDPAERYPDASVLAEDLERFLAGEPALFALARARHTLWGVPRSWLLPALVILALGLGLFGLLREFPAIGSSASRGPPDFSEVWGVSLGPAAEEGGGPRIAWNGGAFFAAWVGGQGHGRIARLARRDGGWGVDRRWWVSAESTCAFPDLASSGRRLAIVYRAFGSRGEPSLHVAFLDSESGRPSGPPVERAGSSRGVMAWSGGRFGLVWETPGRSGFDLRFQLFAEEGEPVEEPVLVARGADQPAIAGLPGGFAVVWHSRRDDHLYLTRIEPGSSIARPGVRVDELGPADKPAVSGGEQEIGVSWHCVRWGKDWVFFRPFTRALEALAPERLAGREGSVYSALTWVGTAYAMVHDTPSQKMPDDVCVRWLDRRGDRGRGSLVSRSPEIPSLEPHLAWNGKLLGVVWNERGGKGAFQSVNMAVMGSRSDLDSDGYLVFQIQDRGRWSGGECNDRDPRVHPGAAERCNGIDDDCDGTVDEGCSGHR